MMPDNVHDSDFFATPAGVDRSNSRAADLTDDVRASPDSRPEVKSGLDAGGPDPWAAHGAPDQDAPVESAQTLRVLLAPEHFGSKRRLFDYVAEFFELDNRGRNNLGPRARADMRAYASLLVGVLLFEFTAWSLLFKFILDPGEFSHVTLMTIPAVAVGALMARMVFWFDRQMLTSDTTGSWWRIGMAMVTRVGILAASAWATAVPMELTMFGAEIDSFNHERTMAETVKQVLDGASAATATAEESLAQRDAKEHSEDAKLAREKAEAARTKADDLVRLAAEIEGIEGSISERGQEIDDIKKLLPDLQNKRDDARKALSKCHDGRSPEGRCDSSQLKKDWNAARRTYNDKLKTYDRKIKAQQDEKGKLGDRLDQANKDYPEGSSSADAAGLRRKADHYKTEAQGKDQAKGEYEGKRANAKAEEKTCFDAQRRAKATREDFLREVGLSEPGKITEAVVEQPPSGCAIQGGQLLHFADKNLTFIERLEILDYLESTVRQPPAVYRVPAQEFGRIRQATHRGFRHESAFIELPATATEIASGLGPNPDDAQRVISPLGPTGGRPESTFSALIERDTRDRRPPNGRSQESADHFLQFRRIIRLVAMVIPFLIVISKFLMSQELTAYYSLKHQARNLDPEAFRVVQDDFASVHDATAEQAAAVQRDAERARTGRTSWWERVWSPWRRTGYVPASVPAEEET